MLKVSSNNQTISITGSALDFASLARSIKKSKFGSTKIIESEASSIELNCSGKGVELLSFDDKVVFKYSESTKNELYTLISMPSDTAIGAVFTIRTAEHSALFDGNSMGLELIVE